MMSDLSSNANESVMIRLVCYSYLLNSFFGELGLDECSPLPSHSGLSSATRPSGLPLFPHPPRGSPCPHWPLRLTCALWFTYGCWCWSREAGCEEEPIYPVSVTATTIAALRVGLSPENSCSLVTAVVRQDMFSFPACSSGTVLAAKKRGDQGSGVLGGADPGWMGMVAGNSGPNLAQQEGSGGRSREGGG